MFFEGADRSRKLQQQMGWPGMANSKSYISNNLIRNCAITIDEINRSQQIYVTPTTKTKGNKTKQFNTQNHVTTIPLPLNIAKKHKDIQLFMIFLL